MKNRQSLWSLAAVFLIGVLLALPLGLYLEGGSHLRYVASSPDGALRAEYYTPRRWQALLHPYAYEMPGYVRISQVRGETLLSESPLFEQDGTGPLMWDSKGASVGSFARFDLATRRWTF
jgi:hypothetical protein